MPLPAYTFVGCDPANYTVRGSRTISGIIDHSIVGTIASATARFARPNSQRASAGAGIGLDGRITMWVEPWDIAHHAGDWPVNERTFGIEHDDDGDPYDPVRTPELYMASAALHVALAQDEGFALTLGTTVRGHRDIVATACPAGLDVGRILTIATEGPDMVSLEEFRAYQQNVYDTVVAMKAAYDPLLEHGHGSPTYARAVQKARREADAIARRLALLRPPKARQGARTGPRRRKPTKEQLEAVRAGHGPGR